MEPLSSDEIRRVVRVALDEDIGPGDVTALSTVPSDCVSRAVMRAREPLVLAGTALAVAAFREMSASIEIDCHARDGDRLDAGTGILTVIGPARAILGAERVALNFVQRLSGIATLTARYVDAVRGTRARILDTRKTTPGLRRLEKYAVTCGGGRNHRFGLFDMVLIKDNHLAALTDVDPDPVGAAVRRARAMHPGLRIEVEADTIEQVEAAVAAGADVVLLDNMSLDQMRRAVSLCAGRTETEASGGVGLESVRAIAETGVDWISAGALTHSARAMDIGLDFEKPGVLNVGGGLP